VGDFEPTLDHSWTMQIYFIIISIQIYIIKIISYQFKSINSITSWRLVTIFSWSISNPIIKEESFFSFLSDLIADLKDGGIFSILKVDDCRSKAEFIDWLEAKVNKPTLPFTISPTLWYCYFYKSYQSYFIHQTWLSLIKSGTKSYPTKNQ